MSALLPAAPAAQGPNAGAGATVVQQSPGAAKRAQRKAQRLARRRVKANRTQRLARFGGMLQQGQGSAGLTLGGGFTSAAAGPQVSVQGSPAPGVYQLLLNDPGTGWQESVLLGVPSVPFVGPRPLLVMFHGADISEWDCYINGVDMFEGARNRGWYVLAPLGAHQLNYGIPYSQVNIEYALSMFVELLPIDEDRIYGVGFSMGGGTLMSYAARHHDLGKPRFAALTNHTGTVSVAFSYWNSQNTSNFDNPLMFNGSPNSYPFAYSQSSAIDIDPNTLAVDSATDLVRNLSHVPTLNYHAIADPLPNLIIATQTIFNHLNLLPGSETFLLTPPQNVHKWWTLDENTALNYMQSKTLQTPREGLHDVLADREANWFHFYIYQDAAGAFTPFRWNMDSLANRLTIDQTSNLQRAVVNSASIGLDTSSTLELVMSATDGPNEITTLTGYANSPNSVLRAGVPVASWSWDSVAQTVTLTESNAQVGALWTIQP